VNTQTWLRSLCVAMVIAAAGVDGAPPAVDDVVPTAVPGADLPVVRQHTYRMAGKVRVLLLWVGRDDVGSGVISWKASGGNKAYELLIGSDPAKAPGQLNKWGYLVEELRGGVSSVVGVISQDNEDELSDVKEGLGTRGGRPFDTIRGRVRSGEAHARVGTLFAASTLTYRDAPALLKMTLADQSKPVRRLDRPADVRLGFLTSLTELIDVTLTGTAGKPAPGRLRYVHGDRLYELRLLETTPLARFERDGKVFEKVIRGRFETARAGARSGTRFELVYGASGALAGIPVLVSYQPKWWLQVDLVLQQ
jgi:hypothetical protein